MIYIYNENKKIEQSDGLQSMDNYFKVKRDNSVMLLNILEYFDNK